MLTGSNTGDRTSILWEALEQLNRVVGPVKKVSALYESDAWGYHSVNRYLNQAVFLETPLSPMELLETTQQIEKLLGRETKSSGQQYEDRPIDIDILFYDNEIINRPNLTIPHPAMISRRFVMEPLCEISSDFRHPVFGKSIKELKSECIDFSQVEKFSEKTIDKGRFEV
ncbi:MAG: 2-amino-4-hydroxy-6-hydroxymethyldihydropteridine diphosphokinase [Bacteroidales bacterium]